MPLQVLVLGQVSDYTKLTPRSIPGFLVSFATFVKEL